MEYSVYCLLCAFAVVISCTGAMTRRLRSYQYIVLLTYVFLVMYFGWSRAGQMLTFLCVGGTVLLACLFLREYRIGNICLGLCAHLANGVFNSLLLWIIGIFSPELLEAVSGRYMLVFSGIWVLILLGLTGLYRYFLYQKWNVKNYFSISPGILQAGILSEILLFAVLFVINITMGQKAEYSVEALGFNSWLLMCGLFVNVVLFLYMGNVIRSEEEKRMDELKYQELKNYAGSVEQLFDSVRMLRHDFRNIISSAMGYIHENDMENLKVYFEKEIIPAVSVQAADSAVIEALSNLQAPELKGFLYEKWQDAAARKVEFRCETGEKLEVTGMKIVDLVRILGIYLDNAVEAAEFSKGRKVWILFIREEGGILIRIENTYDGETPELGQMEQEGYSTKGEGRGLGLYSARQILDKYPSVICETSIEEGIFRQSLYL